MSTILKYYYPLFEIRSVETRKYTKKFDIGLSNYQLLKTKWVGEARQELYSREAIDKKAIVFFLQ